MKFWLFLLLLALLPGPRAAGAQANDTALAPVAILQAVGRIDFYGNGFCTGALIAPDLVLTAAHCLFDKTTGRRIPAQDVEFLAGWRGGQASAYRTVHSTAVHPGYVPGGAASAGLVRHDLGLIRLARPIGAAVALPFATGAQPAQGTNVAVVSYDKNSTDAPTLQNTCAVMARQSGLLVMSCDVGFGASGAPVISLLNGRLRIVSVVSAKAELRGARVSLGVAVEDTQLDLLRAELATRNASAPAAIRAQRAMANASGE